MKNLLCVILLSGILIITCDKGTEPSTQEPSDQMTQGDYLGQTPPGRTFERFAPGIVSAEMHHSPTVSPNGLEIYWAERNGIKYTVMVNGSWTTPEYASFCDGPTSDWYDEAPVISPDNTKLFFNSQRPNPYNTTGGYNFWMVERTGIGWSDPQPLPEIISGTGGIHWQVSVSNSGTLYFGVISGAEIGIWYSRYLNGNYTTPEPVEVLNNFGHVICPFIAPDESYIIFNKVENGGASTDYYICFKDDDDQWMTPQRLDTFPDTESIFVSRDGQYIFCKANWASMELIEDLRPSDPANTITDYDGNVYQTITIGNQTWMAENFKGLHTAGGENITGVYTYNDDETNAMIYGRLYTWEAARNASPDGWHLPSNDEWDSLIQTVGSNPVAKLREGGSTGFNVKLSGRWDSGSYDYIGTFGAFWTSLNTDATHAGLKLFDDNQNNVISDNTLKNTAHGVRYIQD